MEKNRNKVDFHSHILPNIDDGSKSLEITKAMLNISKSEGVEYIAATSHFIPGELDYRKEEYDNMFMLVEKEAHKIGLKVVKGLEIYIDPRLESYSIKNKIWTLNNSRYMLIELPLNSFPLYTEEVFYDLKLDGIVPVIAHPERNKKIIENPDILKKLIDEGCMAQVNSGSLTGRFGSMVKECAETLVKRNLVHLIGSDGHNDKNRTTSIRDGSIAIKKLNDNLYNWILCNEEKIINNEEVQILQPGSNEKKSFFSFFHSHKTR